MNTKLKQCTIYLIVFTLFACKEDKVSVLTPAQQKAQLDSILKNQELELIQSASQSLKDRISIEVKVKTDSILKEKLPQIVQTAIVDTAVLPMLAPSVDTVVLPVLPKDTIHIVE